MKKLKERKVYNKFKKVLNITNIKTSKHIFYHNIYFNDLNKLYINKDQDNKKLTLVEEDNNILADNILTSLEMFLEDHKLLVEKNKAKNFLYNSLNIKNIRFLKFKQNKDIILLFAKARINNIDNKNIFIKLEKKEEKKKEKFKLILMNKFEAYKLNLLDNINIRPSVDHLNKDIFKKIF
jgi:hypothetical protein